MSEIINSPTPAEFANDEELFASTESIADEDIGARFFGMKRSTVMMGVMFLGGIVWVVFVSRQLDTVGNPPQDAINKSLVSAGLIDMERLSMTAKNRQGKTKTMKRVIYSQARHRQIPLECLKENPFMFLPLQKNTPLPEPETQPAATEEPPPDPEPAPKIDDLQLQSIMVGGNSCAMISGNLVTDGQCIRGWTVVEIKDDRVILQWKDQKCVLKMP